MHRSFGAPVLMFVLALCAQAVSAQLAPVDPDWREAAAPPPPPLRVEGLIPIDMPGSLLRYAVDPASVSLGSDGIVRYVVVATSTSGSVNAIYEGVRCSAAEVKVYGRHLPGSGWTTAKDAPWQALHGQGVPRHSLLIARNGACMGHGPNASAAQIVRDLKAPVDNRFRPEYR